MKIKSFEIKDFKRFTHLTVSDIPKTARLVVLIGPNGSGKTSLFEAFRQLSGRYGGTGHDGDQNYIAKNVTTFENSWTENLKATFHDHSTVTGPQWKKAFYIRSAYRNESDFVFSNLSRVGSALDANQLRRLIDNDSRVSDNYQRIVSKTIENVYSGKHDAKNIEQVRNELIGEIRNSMLRVFDSLVLTGPGDPLQNGSFYFEKGIAKDFHYKNLSGGEKAAFDLIVDLLVKQLDFDDTAFCIDEPEIHMHTKLQGTLLEELYKQIKPNNQLWISTHSIGMIKKAVELKKLHPDEVVFLDFHDQDFDKPTNLTPVKVTRDLWKKTLAMALDDLSDLVSPKQIILCEGSIATSPAKNKEFDAKCLRKIFDAEFSDTDFISVGNSATITKDRLDFVSAMKLVTKGVDFIKLVDLDDHSSEQIKELNIKGIKVLNRRDIESYLLDDEIIDRLCIGQGKPELTKDVLAIKSKALVDSIARGNPTDDIKSAAGQFYTETKKLLSLTQCGNDTESFLRDTMAPLVTSDTKVYNELKQIIFK